MTHPSETLFGRAKRQLRTAEAIRDAGAEGIADDLSNEAANTIKAASSTRRVTYYKETITRGTQEDPESNIDIGPNGDGIPF